MSPLSNARRKESTSKEVVGGNGGVQRMQPKVGKEKLIYEQINDRDDRMKTDK